MSVTTNEATGEVTVQLADRTFKLRATMPRVADLQSALDVNGMVSIELMLKVGDARAVYQGMKCLCASENVSALDDMLLAPHAPTAVEAILAALVAGLPEADDDVDDDGESEGNA